MDPTDLSKIPIQWQLWATWFFIAIKYGAEGYSAIRGGGGLKRIIMAFWFGENVPKVIAQDYKEELNTTPPVPVGTPPKTP